MNNRIILGVQQSANIYKSIIRNLELCGFEVYPICFPDDNFQYKNFKQKLINFLRKTFLNDKHYKNKLKFSTYEKEIVNTINSIDGNVDYTLLIRADIYPKNIIKLLKAKSNKIIAYQWDGLSRYPAIYNYIPLFDRFFVFDKNDITKSRSPLLTTTNFYFDYFEKEKTGTIENDLYYIGSIGGNRLELIDAFLKQTQKLNLKNKFIVHYTNLEDIPKNYNKAVSFINKHISYEKNIEQVRVSKILFDLVTASHNGLSFRIFEGIFFEKKIITTNKNVKDYDFYNSNNIYIWDGKTFEGLNDFIESPYQALPPKLVEKYSFSNWIKYILDQKPYIKIALP